MEKTEKKRDKRTVIAYFTIVLLVIAHTWATYSMKTSLETCRQEVRRKDISLKTVSKTCRLNWDDWCDSMYGDGGE